MTLATGANKEDDISIHTTEIQNGRAKQTPSQVLSILQFARYMNAIMVR